MKNLSSRARLGSKPIIITAVAGVILAVGALAGCGTAAAPSPAAAPPAKGALTVKLSDKATNTTSHWSLRCDPAGGTAPDPAMLCKALFGVKDPFGPVVHRIMCPMIIVSAKQIILDGTWYGKKVHRVIIDGGCDLPIFNSLNKTIG